MEGPIVNPETPGNPEAAPGDTPPPPTPPPGTSTTKTRSPAFGKPSQMASSRVKHRTPRATSNADTVWATDAVKASQPHVAQAPIANQHGAEPARLTTTLRQPTSLTARAKQPAIEPAATARVAQKPQIVKQPLKLAQPDGLRPVRPIAGDASESMVQTRETSLEPTKKPEAQLRQPAALIPIDGPIRLTRASTGQAAPQIADANEENADASHVGPHASRGSVAKVSVDAGIVQVKFAGGTQPAIGSRLKVYHEYLMKTACLGELEVVSVGSGLITTRPTGDIQLSKIAPGDAVVIVR
jgi:hypothetical protein